MYLCEANIKHFAPHLATKAFILWLNLKTKASDVIITEYSIFIAMRLARKAKESRYPTTLNKQFNNALRFL